VFSVFSVVKKGLVTLLLLALVGPGVGAQTAHTGEIAYVQDGNIWVRDLATGQARQLTTDNQSILPTWTPDGQNLIFVSGRDGNSEIYRMNPDGTNVTRVTNNPQTDTLPAISRDGTLYFVRLNVGTNGPPPGQDPTAALIRSDFTTETEVYTQPAGLCLPVDLQVYDADHIALSTSCGRGKNVLLVNLQTHAATDVTQAAPGWNGCAADGAWEVAVAAGATVAVAAGGRGVSVAAGAGVTGLGGTLVSVGPGGGAALVAVGAGAAAPGRHCAVMPWSATCCGVPPAAGTTHTPAGLASGLYLL
jgi:hypothetical protein